MFEKLEELAKNNKKISDFHIRSGWPLAFRQTGEIHKVPDVVVKPQDLQDLISTNCNEVEMKRFNDTHELDSSVTLSGLRFRANFYKTINGPAAVLRRVESVIPEMGQFDLPQSLYDIVDMHKGLVLVTGPTGSGKSTTLAAIINEINKTRTSNIITVEDPVEFIHKDLKSIVSHREVGKQTQSFFKMATTTASISINSPDISGDVIAISKNTQLKKAGVSTGLDQTSGVGKKITTSTAQYTLFAQGDYGDNKAHKLYVRVASSNVTEFVTLTIGSQSVGRIYGNDFVFLGWDGTADIKITPSVSTSLAVEYFLAFEV